MKITLIDESRFTETLNVKQNPYFKDYFAFYSSWFGGITTNPHFMLIPMDDHMVHRGDGVFEACKVINRSVYLFDEHLARLLRSAEIISLVPSFTIEEMKHIVLETLRVANQDNAAVRIYLSRGPGGFTVNPYDAVGSQFYVAITQLKLPSNTHYEKGVTIGISNIPIKSSWMAQVKSCNYLPNVLIKKEAVDRGWDFAIVTDENGFITEGATENVLIVDHKGGIVHPEFDNMLKGTTLLRLGELAITQGIRFEKKPITIEELKSAREVILTGTTIDVLPVVELEGQPIGTGKPGPLAKKLRELLLSDMQTHLNGSTDF